jgi:sulfur relay protein TusB/DsrH
MSTLFVLAKTPYLTNDVARVIRIASDMKKETDEVGIIFVQDAVLAAIRGLSNKFDEQITKAIKNGVKIYILEPDATARGLKTDRAVQGIEFIDYGQWVDIVVNNYQRIASWT